MITTKPNRINILSKIEIEAIYDNYTNGATKASLARTFGVSSDTITRAIENAVYQKNQPVVSKATSGDTQETAVNPLGFLNLFKQMPNESFNTTSKHDVKPGVMTTADLCETEPAKPVELNINPVNSEMMYTITPKSVSIIDTTSNPVAIYNCDNDHEHFDEIKQHVVYGNYTKAIDLISPKMQLINFSRGLISIKDSNVFYKGNKICNTLTKLIIDKIASKDDDYERLINFMTKLMDNPSNKAVNRLFDFMQHNDIKILKDGNILTLKSVRSSYMDIYSNSVLNKPGMTIKMDRCMVDDDDNRTCSHGYHVGSVKYVSDYGGSGSKYLTCIVDPAHVVSIPADHNDTKCRVSEYYIDREFTYDEVESNDYLEAYE